ncbi:hypothetical protein [Nonomuraea turcica]|uniref:hypothetical protein n=1 Tax=Nonomuraea sp. G32 TaxID=3067274 RepID=UPI00273C4FDF|nr:hypothetical protein [Nonomuraea sp. G32]MDP4500998.1 hypothetical protein [Nonomuraea sp. G32]
MARIKLRRPEFERRAATCGLDSQREQAAALGVHESIHSRALNGRITLSAPYVIGVLRLLGSDQLRAEIDAVFDVPANDTETAQAAS